MPQTSGVVEKYLQQYAEKEALDFDIKKHNTSYEYCVVIPAFNEHTDFVDRLFETFPHTALLLILVINQPDTFTEPTPENAQLDKHCHALINKLPDHQGMIIVDRFSRNPLPAKQGVGLARKIGCDIACQLIHRNIVKSPWIYSTDADAHLPDNYFSVLNQQNKSNGDNVSAAVFDFVHKEDGPAIGSDIDNATAIYENHLRYYRAGLAYAGSPYSFYTLGSTLAVHYTHYAKVRGFPKRNAAEDFYILNKLAKTGSVLFLPECRITLEARLSQRVPFGTGPAVEKIIQQLEKGEVYRDYNPAVFTELKTLLENFPDFFSNQNVQLSTPLQESLKDIAFEEGLQHSLKQGKALESFCQHLHHWLDGFKTLKLIHFLRDNYYPDITEEEILQDCPFNGENGFFD